MQDGSSFSSMKILTSSMKEEEQWMSQVELIQKTETSSCGRSITVSTNNGISFMLKI
jgi:hypothetical protein